MTSSNVEWTQAAEKALQDSFNLAKERSHGFLSAIHLATALFSDPKGMAATVAQKLGAVSSNIHRQLAEKLATLPTQSPAPPKPSPDNSFQKVLNTAEQKRQKMGDALIAVDHLLLSLHEAREVDSVLSSHTLNEKQIERVVEEMRGGKKITSKFQEANYEALSKYAIDLCARAEEQKLDPVIGRDEEVRRVIRVLARRTKNNPVLVGPPGVGKTAIAEGVAQRIVAGDVPEGMTGRIYSLDVGALIAGASYRGEFEERLKSVIDEVKKNTDQIILFIDEIHLLIGAGKSSEGSMDAANLLKPALARGELRMIGATTLDEYTKYIERDCAFERRVQRIDVSEPSVADCISILRGIKEKYELHHRVQIKDAAVVAAATLSDRYISQRFLPDKAIDLMDEACAGLRVQLDSRPERIDQLERRRTQLEIEKKALEKESGSNKKSAERLKSVVGTLQKINEELQPLLAKYQAEKDAQLALSELKARLEEKKQKLARAERLRDMELAADLRYNAIPGLEEAINDEKKRQEEAKADQMLTSVVTEEDIADVVSRWTGIPVSKLTQSERERLMKLSESIHHRVKGQNEPIDEIATAILRSRAGLSKKGRPTGSFLVAGPTGCGKTETVKAVATELFDTEKSIVRIDCSEYSEAHAVARLTGAPPGYVGFDEGGQLTEAVRRKPFSVVLFDEVEKAHPQLFNILLQVLDDGRLTDSHGRVVDFSNTIVFLTTNLGSAHLLHSQPNMSPTSAEQVKNKVMNEIRQFFRPEFLNRLDAICFYHKLGMGELALIVEAAFNDVNERLKEKNIVCKPTKAASEFVLQESYDPEYGARPVKRYVEKVVVTELSKMIISGSLSDQSEVSVDVNTQRSKLVFTVRRLRDSPSEMTSPQPSFGK